MSVRVGGIVGREERDQYVKHRIFRAVKLLYDAVTGHIPFIYLSNP
jgi:hypothetical protein